jgi:hypothetical protein
MRPALSFLVLLFAIGCGQSRSVTPPSIVSQRTVTVSGDDPFIAMEDGTRIGVDGVPSGQSMQVAVTQYKDSNEKLAIEVDTAPAATPELEQP